MCSDCVQCARAAVLQSCTYGQKTPPYPPTRTISIGRRLASVNSNARGAGRPGATPSPAAASSAARSSCTSGWAASAASVQLMEWLVVSKPCE